MREGEEVTLNPAVSAQMERLRRHPDCCLPLFWEVLDVIEKRLLRCRTMDRAKSDELVTSFEEIYEKCCRPGENGQYLTARRETAVFSGVSEGEHATDFSSEGNGGAADVEMDEPSNLVDPSLLGTGIGKATPKGRSWGWRFWDSLRARVHLLSCF